MEEEGGIAREAGEEGGGVEGLVREETGMEDEVILAGLGGVEIFTEEIGGNLDETG